MAQAGQGRGPEFKDKIMTIYCHKLTNECGSNQGAVTKFIRCPRTAISFCLAGRKEIACRSLLRKKNQQKIATLFLFNR